MREKGRGQVGKEGEEWKRVAGGDKKRRRERKREGGGRRKREEGRKENRDIRGSLLLVAFSYSLCVSSVYHVSH